MSTRTSINIGSLIDDAMKQKLPGFERTFEEYTSQYVVYGYRRAVHDHYHATVLFQVSKTFAGLTCEIGLSRTEDYPYYRFYDSPALGVHGFRVRTKHLFNDLSTTTTKMYSGPDSLKSAIAELTAEAHSGHRKLTEVAMPRISEEYRVWQPLYAEWQSAEKAALDVPEQRYKSLVGESVARKILHSLLQSGQFDGFLGPKKFRYREPAFLNCHVYLLAKALAFVEPPEVNEVKNSELDPGQEPDKILFDPIASLTGRSEQTESIELSNRILERVPQWAFLRSFAALEAFFEHPIVELTDVKQSVTPPPAPKVEPVPTLPQAPPPPSLSLDELYGGVSAHDAPLLDELVADEPQIGQLRPDPFEAIAPFLEESAQPEEKSVDPFDLLGSQLGL